MRNIRFTFVVTGLERQLISSIAHHLNRSQGDALRILIRSAAQELKLNPEQHIREKEGGKGETNAQ